MEDGIVDIRILVEVAIHSKQLQIKNAYQLVFWKCRIHHWSQHIKKGFYGQILSDGCHIFHRWMKEWGVQHANARFVQGSFKEINIRGESNTQIFHDI